MSREATSVLHELDYWRALLEDLRAVNDGILATSTPVASIPIELLPLLFRPGCEPVVERAGELVKQAQAALVAMQTPLEQMIALAEGRLLALRGEGFTGAGEAAL